MSDPAVAIVKLAGGEFGDPMPLHDALVAGSAAGSIVELIDNVDLAGKTWEPIAEYQYTDGKGNEVYGFAGTFDGKGYTISNLTIKAESGTGIGLIGLWSGAATMRNIIIENVDIAAPNSEKVAALVGGGADTGAAVISNITICGTVKIDGKKYVGGVIGHKGYHMVAKDLHVNGTEGSFIGNANATQVGGIAGTSGEGDYRIIDSSVSGVTIVASKQAGGIQGRLFYGNKVIGCSTENVTLNVTEAPFGSIVGHAQNEGATRYILNYETNDKVNPVIGATVTLPNDNTVVGTGFEGDFGSFTAGTFTADATALADVTAQCAAGYAPVANEDGTYTIAKLPDPVAQIGTTPYTTLQAAFAAVKPTETIELLSNVELTEKIVLSDVKCTVDLKGYKITNAESWVLTTYDWLFDILGGCDITFDNGTIELNDRMIYFRLGSVVTFGSELVVDAKKVQYTDNTIRGFGGTLNVYGKVMRAGGEANAFDLPISNSVVNVYAGADISVTPSSGNSCYIFKVGSGVGTAPVVNINGGTIGDATVVFWTYNPNEAVMTIAGGTFEGDSSMFAMSSDKPSNATVTPMTDACTAKFASEIKGLADLCAAGFAPVLGQDGYYTIQAVYNITIASTANGTVETSVTNNIVAGTEVTITATPAANYEVDTIAVTNGEEAVTVENNKFTIPAGNVTVYVTFKSTAQPQGWSEDPTKDEGKAADEIYTVIAESKLAKVDAGTLGVWAKANSVDFAEFVADPEAFENAFLLDCAPSEVETEKAKFKFTEIVPGTQPTIGEAGKYGNGKVVVYGATKLGADADWAVNKEGAAFYKAELVPVQFNENAAE